MTQRPVHHTPGPLAPLVFRGRRQAAWLLTLSLGLLGACDEETAQKMFEVSQATQHAGQPPTTPANTVEAPIAAYDRCYRECYTAHMIPTNRETCKLGCDGLAEEALKTGADPLANREVQNLRSCFVDCWDRHGLRQTDRETCLLTCDDGASVALTPPPKQHLEVVPGTVLTPVSPSTTPR